MKELDKLDKGALGAFFLAFLIFDLFLMPKLAFSTPVSFFLLMPTVLFCGRFSISVTLLFLVLILILCASLLGGIEQRGDLEVDNLKRALQLLLVLALFFFDYRRVDYVLLISFLKKITSFFLAFSACLALLMFANAGLYEFFIGHVYPESAPMLNENMRTLRYSLHFTDPNSFGYLVGFCLVLVLGLNFSSKVKFLLFVISLFLVVTTQSRGAMLAVVIVAATYWLFFMEAQRKIISICAIFVVVAFVVVFASEFVAQYWELFEARAEVEEKLGKGIGGGRGEAWAYFVKNININPLFGVGYHLERDGHVFRPHSDFIRLQLSYGTLFFLIFIAFFNGIAKKYAMLWAAFLVPFMINTVVDDYRLFGVFVVCFLMFKKGRFHFYNNHQNKIPA